MNTESYLQLMASQLLVASSLDLVPGFIAGIQVVGEPPQFTASGCADLELGMPITPASIFNCGSIAKQFTAMLAISLSQEGRFSLSDSLIDYVPELPTHFKTVKLSHLLYHTSGIRDYDALITLLGARQQDYFSERDILTLLCQQSRLLDPPGSVFRYSNSGYFLLALVIRRVTGTSLTTLANNSIFTPTGMTSTTIPTSYFDVVRNRVRSYTYTGDKYRRLDVPGCEVVGGCALLSSARDLLTWFASWYAQRWNPNLLNAMVRPGQLLDGSSLQYGGGLFLRAIGDHTVVTHGGSILGFRSKVAYIPTYRLAIVILANSANLNVDAAVDLTLHRLLISKPQSRQNIVTSSSISHTWLGVYRNAETGDIWVLSKISSDFSLSTPGVEFHLKLNDNQQMLVSIEGSSNIAVAMNTDSSQRQLTLQLGNTHIQLFEILPGEQSSIEAYVGVYLSQELPTPIMIHSVKDQLVWSRRNVQQPLHWIWGDVFRSENVWFSFHRTEQDINGVILDHPRALGLIFKRSLKV